MAAIKLTSAALHLLSEIAAGRNRVFYMSDRPNGWAQFVKHGLAVRDAADDTRAQITDAGRDFLAGKAEVKAAAPHAGNCRCPRCLREHVQNGCRRVNCPVCG